MQTKDFIPASDAGLLAWANNFYSVVTTGTAADFGLTDALMASFQTKLSVYSASYDKAFNPDTRTKPAITERNAARKVLVASARKLAKLAQAAPVMTDAKRNQLKITVPKPRQTIVTPTQRPSVEIVGVVGWTVTANIFDPSSATRRAKPDHCVAAKVYVYQGTSYPSDPSLWSYFGDFSRTTNCEITFPNTAPAGQQIWITAAWTTQKGLTGAAGVPVTTNLQGGGVRPTQGMRMAA